MKIDTVKVSHILGIEHAVINFDKDVITVGGKNGQGKTSLINAIFLCVKKSKAKFEKIIKEGASEGEVEITTKCGLVINHKFTEKGSKLTIKKGEESFSSPQKFLDEIISEISIDPIAFINIDDKKKLDLILGLNGVDVDELNRKIKSSYDERTIVNRELKTLETELSSVKNYSKVDKVDISALSKQLQDSEKNNNDMDKLNVQKMRLLNEQKQLENRIKEIKNEITGIENDLAFMDFIETSDIVEKINSANDVNEKASGYLKKVETEKKIADKYAEKTKLDNIIEGLRESKTQILNKLNIPGLSVDDDDNLLINGVPLQQCSSSEQIKIAMSIAMMGENEFKFLRIDRGESLDDDNMDLIKKIASENDYQMIITKVGQAEIMMEGGKIK